MSRMRPPLDMGPCQVKGLPNQGVITRARVMWEDGVLYVARTPADVVAVGCSDIPAGPVRLGRPHTAVTSLGSVTFSRRGCSCSYRIGQVASGQLVDAATRLDAREGVESTQTPSLQEDTP